MERLRRLAGFTLLCLASLSVQAQECMPRIESGWIRQPPMAMPMMAGFAEVANPCDAPVSIVGAGSPAFASVELHETRKVDGVSRMRHVETLTVPAGGKVALAPGGLHLMLMRPNAEIEAGQRIAIELELSDGRKLRGEFEVRKPDAL